MALDPRSAKNLEGVHEDLHDLFSLVRANFLDLMVMQEHMPDAQYEIRCIEGLRDIERQEHLVEIGASKTMNSRHLTGHAFDFAIWVNGEITWEDKYYDAAGRIFKRLSSGTLHIPITWGGDWPSHDGPHIQLTWAAYPLSKKPKTEANSKTIAAGAGTGAVVILQEIVPQITGLDIPWAKYIVLAVVLALVGLIIYERAKKIDDEGV